MTASSNALLKLILDSQALSIWNHATGPVFWYAAGVPGPFYLNTELMIGRELAEKLLEKITAIVADHVEPAVRAGHLQSLIQEAYQQNADYQTVIRGLIEKAKSDFPAGRYTVVSGGERRDWLFSIPFAAELGVKHLYLFKNKSLFCAQPLQADEKVLHVSDLINNAASYFDLWLPILNKANLACAGTLTVNTRGTVGLQRLEEAGYPVAAINRVDLPFFQQLRESNLIEPAVLEEIATYFASSKEWAARYLMGNAKLFDLATPDKKSFERMASFFNQDPWGLRDKHAAFFNDMRSAIAARKAA